MRWVLNLTLIFLVSDSVWLDSKLWKISRGEVVVAEIKVPEVIAEQETPVKIESPEDKVLREKQEKGDRSLQETLYASTQDTKARNSC